MDNVITKLSCQGCGAPLRSPEYSNYVSCEYCGNVHQIKRERVPERQQFFGSLHTGMAMTTSATCVYMPYSVDHLR